MRGVQSFRTAKCSGITVVDLAKDPCFTGSLARSTENQVVTEHEGSTLLGLTGNASDLRHHNASLHWCEGELLDCHSVLRRLIAPEPQSVLARVEGERDRPGVLPVPDGEGHLDDDLGVGVIHRNV